MLLGILFTLLITGLCGILGFYVPFICSSIIYGKKTGYLADLPEAFLGMFFAGIGIMLGFYLSGNMLSFLNLSLV